jgi:type IV secretory pathway VirB3-like protein
VELLGAHKTWVGLERPPDFFALLGVSLHVLVLALMRVMGVVPIINNANLCDVLWVKKA